MRRAGWGMRIAGARIPGPGPGRAAPQECAGGGHAAVQRRQRPADVSPTVSRLTSTEFVG